MDQATALKILQNYGAPNNPDNLSRVMSQTGPADAILARSMGLQGANDESGNALDKLAFASERPVPTAVAPIADTGAQIASAITPQAPIARAPIPAAPVTNVGKRGSTMNTEPDVVPEATPATAGYTAPSIWQWLLPALGITSAAGRAAMGPSERGPTNGQSMEDMLPEPKVKAKPRAIGEGGVPITESGQTPQNDAVDKIAAASESRRPINTNADERNSEPVNKPVNLESRPVPIDDSNPVNLVEEVAKTVKRLKGVRK